LVVIGIAIAGIGRQAGSQEHFDIGASHITRPPRSPLLTLLCLEKNAKHKT
jgi:hypothetical protein